MGKRNKGSKCDERRGPSASVSLRSTPAEGPLKKRENSQFKLSGKKEPPQKGLQELIEILDKCEKDSLIEDGEINSLRNQLTTILADWNTASNHAKTSTLDPNEIRMIQNQVNSAFLKLIDDISKYSSFCEFIKK